MVTYLYLVRHGETEWNEQGRIQGQQDVPLSEGGRRQARRLARRLSDTPPAAVYTSDLKRARETADILAAPWGLAVHPTPALRETCFGHWEGLTDRELADRFPQELARWRADPVGGRAPGGESAAEVQARVTAALQEIVQAHAGQRVLVVSHAGPLKVAVCAVLGLSLAARGRLAVYNASLHVVAYGAERPCLLLFNDTCHLPGPAGPDRA